MSSIDKQLSQLTEQQDLRTTLVSFRLTERERLDLKAAVEDSPFNQSQYIVDRLFNRSTPHHRALRCIAELHALGIALHRASAAGKVSPGDELDDVRKRTVALIDRLASEL